jgi:hypothetical protein
MIKINGRTKANQMKKNMGSVDARHVSEGLVKTLSSLTPGDLSAKLWSTRDLKKLEHFWSEVRSILAKMENRKGQK